MSKDFNKRKTSHGVTVNYSGTISAHGNAINPSDQWYKGVATAKVTKGVSNVNSMKVVVQHTAYGILSTSGSSVSIGKVHSSKLTSSTGQKW